MILVQLAGNRCRGTMPTSVKCRMSDHRTLIVWRMADALARGVLALVVQAPLRQHFVLRDQLTRACLSVPCNIVEGYARSSAGQLKYHLDVAIGSLAEARYLLALVADLALAASEAVDPLRHAADALHPRLIAFARTVQDGTARHSRFPKGPRSGPIRRGGEVADGAP